MKIKPTISDILNGATAKGLKWFFLKYRNISTADMLTKLEKCKSSVSKLSAAAAELMDMIAVHQLETNALGKTVEAALSSKPSVIPVSIKTQIQTH